MSGLRAFVEEFEPIKLKRPLNPVIEPAKILWSAEETGKPVVFSIRGRVPTCVGSILSRREAIWKALNVNNDIEAYRKLVKALSSPPREVKVEGYPGGLRKLGRSFKRLPSIKFYGGDGGEYITSSIVVACVEGVCNASIHRILVKSQEYGVIRIVPRHLWRMYMESYRKKKPLPISIAIGVEPVYLIASAMSPRFGVFEFNIASELRSNLKLVESPIHGNPVPWPAATLIEAELLPEMDYEGPFVDVTRTYDTVRKQPILKVLDIFINEDEYFHVILPGGREHSLLMGFPREAVIWDYVSRVVPRVYSVRLTEGGGRWLHAVISIEKTHDGDAKNAILAAFAAHPSLKHVIVVDGDINIDDYKEVEWAIATRFRADRDLILIRDARGSSLDPSSREGLVTKMGVDATAPVAERDRYRMVRVGE